ncbi:MAG: tyrosine--tRNA ligase [Vicinamibacterales bacterium]|jgi:tyrosyl-tRNA synthetase|nr:tyrosine--tRNA ligase [Acidobacteriota bacterium]MDP7294487.1 tyrosine--tRNA ligase [Vicinamibacterales bacterium]MDP7471384.1 tyrosine--tRNA ligase [Vicinamibacterales bacterium]MDP7691448.1 tyrosine--tRNA ligase [Vicinamibacterales bacterium]HJO37875.1 tyrosine--tRNA ligase [Vicinamibacterales bacterium]|tara:strand:- start:790 stop:1995 length:1206 start_codon:yes stop_codon:yes gene_type:complete
MKIDQQLDYLSKGCVDVVRIADLHAKLERATEHGQKLVVKVGFDPTAPDLHLGHTVLFRKMKHFQDLGHTVVFVVGDFTALIGDPTGRSKTRPPLTAEQIAENAETYKTQVFKLLDRDETVIEFNSRWLGALASEDWVSLAARYNVAQMLERRDFRQRYDKGQPIAIHEFLYPLAQAYDSVHLKADVELGGTDQLFNLNVGRDVMPSFELEPQIVMTVPLLVGLDGVEKMAKSSGNYVGITESPVEMFGKLMSISDDLMWTYYELLTDDSTDTIAGLKTRVADGSLHPKEAKVGLAKRVVADFHSAADANAAVVEFDRVYGRGERPSEMPEFAMSLGDEWKPLNRIMVDVALASSSSDATRKIAGGAVSIDGAKVADRHWKPSPGEYVLQVGRRHARLVVR